MYSFTNGEYIKWLPLKSLWNAVTEYLQRFVSGQYQSDYKHAEEPYNLYAWLERMDWSKLRRLELDEISSGILKAISPALVTLEHLDVSYGSSCAAETLSDFLANLTKPLRHLRIGNVMFDDYSATQNSSGLLSSLAQFGNNLSHLAIYETESARHRYCFEEDAPQDLCPNRRGSYYLDRPFLNASQLLELTTQNPGITHLEFDVARIASNLENHSTWTIDHSALRQAALLPNLTHLEVRVESPDFTLVRSGYRDDRLSDHGRLDNGTNISIEFFSHDPAFDRTSVPAMFAELNEQRERVGLMALRQMVIKVGRRDYLDIDWGMGGPPDLLVGKWICEAHDDDGTVKCWGGNSELGDSARWYRDGDHLKNPYSDDWSQPDTYSEYWYDDGEEYGVFDLD